MYWNKADVTSTPITELGLTLTWDVLKLESYEAAEEYYTININMRCIEMNIARAKTIEQEND